MCVPVIRSEVGNDNVDPLSAERGGLRLISRECGDAHSVPKRIAGDVLAKVAATEDEEVFLRKKGLRVARHCDCE